ncbi:MAG: hypothetical protein CBD16_01360 [Betaproteobacteria bacterium TMED156]|nr:MAG: hypothetical protein CBD16_01360 [Betaproteobacteria bacterium TMED156]
MRYSKITFCSIFLYFGLLTNSVALDIESGKQKAEGICAGCHGKDGINGIFPSYPILAGQHQDYLQQALNDYKSGARNNAVMSGIAGTLSREDIINISAYFSSLPGPLHLKKRQ